MAEANEPMEAILRGDTGSDSADYDDPDSVNDEIQTERY